MTKAPFFRFLIFVLPFFAEYGCTSYKPMVNKDFKNWAATPLPSGEPSYRIFLSGDGGEPLPDGTDPYLIALKKHLEESGENAALLFLGDNIYPHGLPDTTDPQCKSFEKVLLEQIAVYKNFKGKVFWVAGNHDWDEGHEHGLANRLNQERFVEEHSGRGNIYFPDSGCPGPAALDLSDDVVLLLLDTQWWLHKYDKPLNKELCGVSTEAELTAAIQTELDQYKGKSVFVAAHHPMETCGPHGGKYPWRSHLFPLTEFNRKLWIPLPVLGSAYVYGRKAARYIQDVPNPNYRRMQRAFEGAFEKHPGTTYVNGHDHSLQLIRKNGINYITSGSASQVSHVVKKPYLDFGLAGNGYVLVSVYPNGERWAEFYRTSARGRELVFREKLH